MTILSKGIFFEVKQNQIEKASNTHPNDNFVKRNFFQVKQNQIEKASNTHPNDNFVKRNCF